jgi:drug/metabolite transporter (DMT)-like permease
VLVAVAAALAAALCFALAGVLQQRAAVARPEDETLSPRLIMALARRPMWLAGIGCAVLAYGFQSLALAFAPLSLVQPLIVTELVFAIPLSLRVNRLWPGIREWLGILAVAGGLGVALAAARPRGGDAEADAADWLATLSAVGVFVCCVVAGGGLARGTARASLLALAGGVVMGVQSVLLAATIEEFSHGVAAVLTAWRTYLLIAASAGGLLLIQSALSSGPLAASMTVIDAAEPVVAVAVGVGLFGETVRAGWPAGALAAAGVAAVLAGIVTLDTSPLIRALYESERRRRPRR